MISKKLAKRFSDIGHGTNTDASDEYYTLYHAFAAAFLELLCRYKRGIEYEVIICPCDSKTSVFRELERLKGMIGNPRIIYSFYPEKDWADYFDMDYEAGYGCPARHVCIFTNPPFKGLTKAFREIKCDFILFGANSTGVTPGLYCKFTGGFKYTKNNTTFDGNADNFQETFGSVSTCFFSNKQFVSAGPQYQNRSGVQESLMFGKDRLTRIDTIAVQA